MRMSAAAAGLTVLWRGSLASCNYGCPYCPFAKTQDDRQALAADRAALERFSDWATTRPFPLSILFTPWGEALIRNYYRAAMVRLSRAANVASVAIQTNLSCSVDWIADCDLTSAALWTTYHPGEVDRATFVAKILELETMRARYSVGVVGLKEHLDEIEALRRELPDAAYLWVNAYKRAADYYDDVELERLVAVDPWFELNNRDYASRGRACHAGETVISVLADGTARRCHFLKEPIGNIYSADFEAALRPRACPAETCRCHIGYSHLKELELGTLFGAGFIERRPQRPPLRGDGLAAMARFDQA
jgi:MoaA/NifB/PqqE/SkfB family radical SAM enzyme